ncbi:hypothetical protein AW097_18540 [Escherichia coli]|nr:DUF551 domain-containing protein [Escherichia coli]EFG2151949.1 DUF551 domain-containing protein [Escherichia coli]EFK1707029.1 DUF551 domain-containing protein [Escherichia coli]EIH5454679.1 DUF551 domain-containing protein [Escherichia coli]EIH8294531.1 DUF551 domain-containing protein [Escherichia coli]
MTTITKERIELFIKNPLENGLTRGEQMELARIALASLEADPVKRVNSDQMRRVCLEANRHLDKYDAMAKEVNKLLGRIAPPAPVVPEEATPENVEMLSGYVSTYKLTDSERDIAAEIWNACRAAMLQSGNFRENKNSSTNNFREIAETSTSYPAIPSEVLSAILKVARIRADFDDFDGDRRGIGDCLDEAEQELIVTINKYASQLAAEPIAANDVREQQTAVPPVPEIQADVAQAIENLKQKLVECNRYNYCADAVKGVEDACRAVSYSQADNQPASGNQAAESNRGNEWTGNPDIDNAIIMLDRIDTLENCDDDRIEAVKAVLRRLAVNSPVTPDGWISCSERMPEKNQNVLISVNFDSSLVEPLICSARYTGSTFRRGDATIKSGNGIEQATHWMPLPEPPKEA